MNYEITSHSRFNIGVSNPAISKASYSHELYSGGMDDSKNRIDPVKKNIRRKSKGVISFFNWIKSKRYNYGVSKKVDLMVLSVFLFLLRT